MPKIIRALSADAHLVVSLLCRETVRSCGGLNGAELSALQTYLVRAAPRHPASVRTCSMWFPVLFRFLAHSLTTFGRWGCGERCHLSHVVGNSVVVLSGISRQIAPQTRSEALRRTKRVLNDRQGMEGAKTRYRRSQEVRRADTPNQGRSGSRRPRQPPAKPICTEQAATQLVGGRRPSVLQRWGSGVLPRRFPVALKALPEPWQGTGRKMSAFQGPRANVGQGIGRNALEYFVVQFSFDVQGNLRSGKSNAG